MQSLIDPVVALAEKAGRAILKVYSTDFSVQDKDDDSPLTQADLASHRCIAAGLAELTPDIPVISEEDGLPDFATRSAWKKYWLIDPLDGTKEFINRNGEFTVNICVDFRRQSHLRRGPCTGAGQDLCRLRWIRRRNGATRAALKRSASQKPAVPKSASLAAARNRGKSLDAYLEKLGPCQMIPMGSSLKILRGRRRWRGRLPAPGTNL